MTAWNNKVILVGDASHALSGAFGSGAGFAMEDGWVLAQALQHFGNDTSKALPLFDRIRVPYYHRMYEYLSAQAEKRAAKLAELEVGTAGLTEEERVKVKVIREGKDMSWIYQHHIGRVWDSALSELKAEESQ